MALGAKPEVCTPPGFSDSEATGLGTWLPGSTEPAAALLGRKPKALSGAAVNVPFSPRFAVSFPVAEE